MQDEFDAVCFGLNLVDVLVRCTVPVTRGEKHLTEELVIQGGAPAGNAASVIASLGARTAFFGFFGENVLSRAAREEFRRVGVLDDLFISSPSARPAVAVVQIDPESGERTVFYNVSGYRYAQAADIPPDIAKRSRLFLVDGYETAGAIRLLKLARRENRPSVLDLESGPPEILNEMLALGTDAVLPLASARNLSGYDSPDDVLENLRNRTDAALVVTDGVNGAWADAEGSILHQPAFPVEAKDTTGCGDAFHGAYAVGLLQGWDLKERLEFASYVSSRVALALGGRANIPTMDDFREADLSGFSDSLKSRITNWAARD